MWIAYFELSVITLREYLQWEKPKQRIAFIEIFPVLALINVGLHTEPSGLLHSDVQQANKTRLWATLQWLSCIHYLWAVRMEDGNWHTDLPRFSSLLTPILRRFSLANIRSECGVLFQLQGIQKLGTIPRRRCQACTQEEHSSPSCCCSSRGPCW